jgi:hypothetical protein
VSIDWRVLAFTAAIAVLTALLFGTIPAIRASRVVPGHGVTSSIVEQRLAEIGIRIRHQLRRCWLS